MIIGHGDGQAGVGGEDAPGVAHIGHPHTAPVMEGQDESRAWDIRPRISLIMSRDLTSNVVCFFGRLEQGTIEFADFIFDEF